MKPRHLDLLENFEPLPLSATLPIPVAAAFLGLSEKTIRRYFPLVLVWTAAGACANRNSSTPEGSGSRRHPISKMEIPRRGGRGFPEQ